jgi:superfamily II DNA/RNA helicase
LKSASTKLDTDKIFQAIVFVDSNSESYEGVAGVAEYLEKFVDQSNTKEDEKVGVEEEIQQLRLLGVSSLSDTMHIAERAEQLEAFRAGKTSLLVCADFASRGLDLPNTSTVIQMSL